MGVGGGGERKKKHKTGNDGGIVGMTKKGRKGNGKEQNATEGEWKKMQAPAASPAENHSTGIPRGFHGDYH